MEWYAKSSIKILCTWNSYWYVKYWYVHYIQPLYTNRTSGMSEEVRILSVTNTHKALSKPLTPYVWVLSYWCASLDPNLL